MAPPFNFASIPGCIVWLETGSEGPIRDRLRLLTDRRNDHFIWVNPNNPDESTLVVFDHPLADAELKRVQAALVERYNDDLSSLPSG